MLHPFSLSVFTIEINGTPTVALQAKRHQEAERFCERERLRANLSTLTSEGVPLFDAKANLTDWPIPKKSNSFGKQRTLPRLPMSPTLCIWWITSTIRHKGQTLTKPIQGYVRADIPLNVLETTVERFSTNPLAGVL